ncbi:MAG TPA: DUF2975 domain-containing protein [Candidatus Saccharimonadales bacterium]
MKQGSTLFLRLAIILIGLFVLTLCVYVLPLIINDDNTGFYKPLLLGLYAPALPFFWALYHSLKLLGYIDANNAFSSESVKAFKAIKYCGIIIGIIFALASPYVYKVADMDDAPGVLLIHLVIAGASFVIAAFSALMQKLVQSAVDIKSENDLTV